MGKAKEKPTAETVDEAIEQAETAAEPETIQERVERVGADAKKHYSLRERLRGFKKRTAKVPLFFDLAIMTEVAQAKAQADGIFEMASRPGLEPNRQQELLDQHTEALDRYDALKAELAGTMAVVHLQTVPSVASEAAVRRARKRISSMREVMVKRMQNEKLSDEARAEASEWLEDESEHFNAEINVQSLVKGIDHISYPDGGVSVGLTVDDVRELHETLPANQWQQLTVAFENLIFDERVARSAVDEPGFSQGS